MSFTARVINFVLALLILIFAAVPEGSIFSVGVGNWVIVICAVLIIIQSLLHGALYGSSAPKAKAKARRR